MVKVEKQYYPDPTDVLQPYDDILNSLTLEGLAHLCNVGFSAIKDENQITDKSRLEDIFRVFKLLELSEEYLLAATVAKDYGLYYESERFAIYAIEKFKKSNDRKGIQYVKRFFSGVELANSEYKKPLQIIFA